MRILLLCQYDPFQAEAVSDHINALAAMPSHDVDVLSFGGDLPDDLDLEYYDAIVVHYTTFIYENRCLSPLARWRIRSFSGLKAIFLHDEYKHVDLTTRGLLLLGADVLFTVIPEHAWPNVYPRDRIGAMKLVNILTGYVPDRLVGMEAPGAAARRIDIGYRGRIYPAWHGRAGQERVRIAERVKADAARFDLRTDIELSEGSRLYGRRWTAFMADCKSMLGTESDVSVIDRTGEVARKVEQHQRLHPETGYDEMRRLYFADLEGKVSIAQVSPRIFEGIAMRTLQVLYEGGYSGVIEPNVHYLPLRRDHANFPDIAAFLKNPAAVDAMTDRAYRDVIASGRWAYSRFGATVSAALETEWRAMSGGRPGRRQGRRPPRRIFGDYKSPLHRHVLRNRSRHMAASAFDAVTSILGDRVRTALKLRVKRLLGESAATKANDGTASPPAISASGDSLALIHARAGAIAARLSLKPIVIEIDVDRQEIRIGPGPAGAMALDVEIAERLVRDVMAGGGVGCVWVGGDVLGIAGDLLSCEPIALALKGAFVDTGAALAATDVLPDGWNSHACVILTK